MPNKVKPTKLPVRLFNTKTMETVLNHDFPKSVQDGYVAVSHVWGEQIFYSPEQFGIKSGIDWKIPLSRTNKMDMLIAAMKKFKMEWCWFDVLCMPQNKQDEINKEIPFMGDYYNGAKMTLVFSDEKGPGDDVESLLVSGIIKGISTITKHTSVMAQVGLWGLDDEPWISRLWTFQEAVMSKQIHVVSPYKNYLDMTDVMERLVVADEKSIFLSSEDPTMNLARAIRDYGEHKTSVGRMLYECRYRKCYKPQDKYYGMLGILGYNNFPVTYDITMEDLAKKFMEHAYYNGDVSWLAVYATNEIGFVPSYEGLVYIGEQWREEKSGSCNIKFTENTLFTDACIVANVVHLQEIVNDDIELYDVYKKWEIDEPDVVRALVGYCKLSDGETKSLMSFYNPDDISLTSLKAVLSGAGIPGGGNVGKLFKKYIRHTNVKWQTVCKLTCLKTGKAMLMTLYGKCDIGDKIMLLPMYDIHERYLGIVVDDNLKRKGICLYPKSDIFYEYTSYEFPL